MVERILRIIGMITGLFMIGSSNYVLSMIVLGKTIDVASGIVLYIGAGITYVIGVILLAIAYALTGGRRDIPMGITLIIAGLLHYYPIVNAYLTDISLIFVWALQFSLSITMSIISFYLAYRKLRRRLVEIPVYSYSEY